MTRQLFACSMLLAMAGSLGADDGLGRHDEAIRAERSRLLNQVAGRTIKELEDRVEDADKSVAMAAAWRLAVDRSLASSPQGSIEMREKDASDFLATFSGAMGFPAPAPIKNVIAKCRIDTKENVYFPVDNDGFYDAASPAFQGSGELKCSTNPNGTLSLGIGDVNWTLTKDETDKLIELGYTRVSAAVGGLNLFLAFHDSRGTNGALYCLDNKSRVVWTTGIWGCNRYSLRGVPSHICVVQASREKVLVTGADSHSVFAETFTSQGVPIARFNSRMWYIVDTND